MPQHASSLVPGQEGITAAHPRTAPQHAGRRRTPAADGTASGTSPFPRRIVFLARRDLDNPAAGGSELLVDRVADGLTAAGHQVTLLCGGPAAYRDYRVVSAGGDAGHFLRAKRAFARQVGDCDLLVEVCNGMPYLSPLWHKGPTLCLVNHVHSDLWDMRYPGPMARLGRRLEHWALAGPHRGSLTVAVSDSTAAALRSIGVRPEGIRVVHNGVDAPGPLLPKAPEPLFVAVGRLVEYKRIDLLLRLWERVRPVTGGQLLIVGDGPERERLQAMAGPGVVFTGRVSEAEKHRLLCRAWLLLHPSLVEGWGLVVTEAAARGTPAVGFDIPGLRDSVVNGVTGVLAGGESSFAAAWSTLALSPDRRRVMGRAAEARAENFRWSSTVRQFREVAAEACRAAARSTPGGPAPAPDPSLPRDAPLPVVPPQATRRPTRA
ncbi:glycosyltransferase family 1 protein [Streptomyces cyaneochromogenes]|uniref:Glycosyltransferase family 1 protein n=1 Tax=Streptomyces cyaneochromogenes TaxID=2496836 RepID=A0A3S9LZW4_9ACTN|nr:glycosyltransferase family 4 protein [Streptomyces cyaneochromogenes]AZQ32474.1 glycosyltransferase family 1 protein [Streptomyces cyaneochromogenes]